MTETEINQRLYEIAKSFDRTNEVYSFSFDVLPCEISNLEAIENYFCRLGKDESEDWSVSLSESISSEILEKELEKWLSIYITPMSHLRENLRKQILECIEGSEIHYVYTKPASFYDCDWVDFYITNSAKRWLLHLGISD